MFVPVMLGPALSLSIVFSSISAATRFYASGAEQKSVYRTSARTSHPITCLESLDDPILVPLIEQDRRQPRLGHLNRLAERSPIAGCANLVVSLP